MFLLDTRSGRFFGLDPQDSCHWLALNAGGAVDGLSDADDPLLAEARDRGWVLPPTETPPHRCRPHGSAPIAMPNLRRRGRAAHAYACLARSYLSIRFLPFSMAYTWAARAVSAAPATPPPDLHRVLTQFSWAERALWSRRGMDDCLPRSLALFVFLRQAGLPVIHRIGVCRYPFRSHAWVEHEAVPLLDDSARIARYTPIATLGGGET